ncbi:MAG: NIF family HAD-type phosphatase [Bacteriovoracaceae bacterium]
MIKIFLLVLLCIQTQLVFGQVKHIVFDIEGTLVQGIPEKNFNRFQAKSQMISVKTDRNYYYYIYPYVSYLLNYLQANDDVVVHFATSKSAKWATQVLAAINLPKPHYASLSNYLESNTVNKLLTDVDLAGGKFNLKKITSDLKNVIFITAVKDQLPVAQKGNELFIGTSLYYFEQFETLEADREAMKKETYWDQHKAFFAKSEKEWTLDQNKIVVIYQWLKEAKVLTTGNLTASLKTVAEDKPDFYKKGKVVASYNFQESVTSWKMNGTKDKILGCGVYSPFKDSFTGDLPLANCLSLYSTVLRFQVDVPTKSITGCKLVDEAHNAFIEKRELKECLEKSDEISYYWIGKKRDNCYSYYQTSYKIKKEADELCGDDYMVSEGGKDVIKKLYFVDGKLVDGVGQILAMEDGETVDPRVYEDFDSQMIALTINKRIYERRDKKWNTDKPDYNFMDDTRVVMAFNINYLESIKTGCFINQHEIGQSGGLYDPIYRANLEDGFLNIKLESSYSSVGKKAHQVRPKYSYLLLDKYRPDMGLTSMYSQYGNVMAKFKEEVKNRSTFTFRDSLNMKATAYDVRTLKFRTEKLFTLLASGEYYETQIWGKLCLTDVEYLLVNCPKHNALNSTQINALKATGIPVYECSGSINNETGRPYNVTKGNRL